MDSRPSVSIKRSRPVITIVVAVLICVFSVATSQAIDPLDKGQAPARRTLKTIIVDDDYPDTFMNERRSPDGFSVEVIKAVAKAKDLDLEIHPGTWEEATKELESGTIDLLPMMAYSVERDKKFDFSVPHTIAYDAIFQRKGDKSFGSLTDLSGKTVIVMNKDAAHDDLLSSGLSKTMRLQLVDSLPEALRQLSSGKGDAAIMPKLVGILTLKKRNLSNIDASPPVIESYTRPFSFAVKDGNQELLERLNQGLGIIKSTGQYDAISKKWIGALEGPHVHWKSVLQLLFPAVENAGTETRTNDSSSLPDWRGKGTILLVDDEESLLALGSRMLEHLGFTVLTAADGQQAVDLYRGREKEIGLVLMDLMMPHMDGAEAFGELRRLNPEVRVVLASGYNHEDVTSRFEGKRLDGVLQKPYTLANLREALAGLMPARSTGG
jgi:ABC-type amino acid transport substrate-binding protein/CheY-like chemotaxis protein